MIDNNPLLQPSFTVDPLQEVLSFNFLGHLNIVEQFELAKIGLHITNPYHNLTHELLVAYHALSAYYLSNPGLSTEDDLAAERCLAIAALFHDHNHSGGKTSDAENIERATARIITLPNLSDSEQEIIVRNVKQTEFTNGKFPHEPNTFIGQCLRDADLCMIYTNEGRKLLMELPREIDGGLSLYRRNSEDRKRWLYKNYDFLKSCEMFTEYGQRMKEFHLERACQDLEDLVNYAVGANYVAGHSKWLDYSAN